MADNELGVDASVYDRLDQLERSHFGRAIGDPVEEEDSDAENGSAVESPSMVGE